MTMLMPCVVLGELMGLNSKVRNFHLNTNNGLIKGLWNKNPAYKNPTDSSMFSFKERMKKQEES